MKPFLVVAAVSRVFSPKVRGLRRTDLPSPSRLEPHAVCVSVMLGTRYHQAIEAVNWCRMECIPCQEQLPNVAIAKYYLLRHLSTWHTQESITVLVNVHYVDK